MKNQLLIKLFSTILLILILISCESSVGDFRISVLNNSLGTTLYIPQVLVDDRFFGKQWQVIIDNEVCRDCSSDSKKAWCDSESKALKTIENFKMNNKDFQQTMREVDHIKVD